MMPEDRFDSLILYWAATWGRNPRQVKRQIRRESNFDPYASSAAGAVGLLQFEPATWEEWADPRQLITDADAQIQRGCQYMAWLEKHLGQLDLALAAYDWGIGDVQRVVAVTPGGSGGHWLAKTPAETQAYVHFCLDYLGETFGVATVPLAGAA